MNTWAVRVFDACNVCVGPHLDDYLKVLEFLGTLMPHQARTAKVVVDHSGRYLVFYDAVAVAEHQR